jgi:hypothetical protein
MTLEEEEEPAVVENLAEVEIMTAAAVTVEAILAAEAVPIELIM